MTAKVRNLLIVGVALLSVLLLWTILGLHIATSPHCIGLTQGSGWTENIIYMHCSGS